MGKIVEIEGVNKIYGSNHVVRDLNLSVDEGEFLSVEKHHIDELTKLVMDGKIADGKTVIAVLKAKRLLENEK